MRRRSAAWTGRNRDGAQDARLSITIAMAISISSWPIMLTSKRRIRRRRATRSGCNWKGMPVPCGPRGLKGETMTLYHNDGHGHFLDVTKQAGIETPA